METFMSWSSGDIVNKKVLEFNDQDDLKDYYEKKYRKTGYKNGYKIYDVDISKLYHSERIKKSIRLLSIKSQDVLLDLGCGNGILEKQLYDNCRKIYALDVTRKAFQNLQIPNVTFLECNIEVLPFEDSSIDKIVCIETLEHVLNPKRVISESYRVLKKGGCFVLSYPFNNYTLVKRIERFLGLTNMEPISEHISEWPQSKLLKNFDKFTLVDRIGIVFDLGIIGNIKRLNKTSARIITNFQLSINSFPANSKFIIFKFVK